MSRWVPLRCGITASFLALFCVALFTPGAKAQSQQVTIRDTGQTVPVCRLSDLDSSVVFFSNDTDFIVGFNLRNISERACAPQPSGASPMFDLKPDQKIKPFELCMDCEDRLPNGQYLFHDPVVLNPWEVAHQTYRWKTVAPNETVRCLRLTALFAPVLVSAPTLLSPVCSDIAVSRTYAGAFVPPAPKGEPHYDVESSELLVLSSRKPRYYQDEIFTLHVGLVNSLAGSPSGEECPTLFLRERSPDGTTRFDEVRPCGFKTCKYFSLGADRSANWQSGFEVDSGVRSRWTGIGEHSFELFQLVDSSHDGRFQFVRSNKLTVQIDDPALIARKWLGKFKGVGVDVTLDKGVYQLGENVPLHIAIENFDAPVPIYATSPVWDPYTAIGVEVRDVGGRFLAENERFPIQTIWTGHGRGLFPYPPGKLETIERTLAGQGWLPNRPGVYTVVVTWCTFDGTQVNRNQGPSLGANCKRYATVQATATLQIVDESPAASH